MSVLGLLGVLGNAHHYERALGALKRLVRSALSLIRTARGCDAPRGKSPWLAGAVMRWHTHPALGSTSDRIDGHSARVAVLILQFMPDAPVELLRAAILHDLGEGAVGDIASPVKHRHPEVYEVLEALEVRAVVDMGFSFPALSPHHSEVLRLCDGFDAYLWALWHRRGYVGRSPAWAAHLVRLRDRAEALGFSVKFNEILRGVEVGQY